MLKIVAVFTLLVVFVACKQQTTKSASKENEITDALPEAENKKTTLSSLQKEMDEMKRQFLLFRTGGHPVQPSVIAIPGPPGPAGRDGRPGRRGPRGPPGTSAQPAVNIQEYRRKHGGGGVSYIRWGRTKCGADSSLVYSGVAGGGFYNQQGGGANYICLHNTPQWNTYTDRNEGHAYIYGSEYELTDHFLRKTNARHFHNRNVPCAVCLATRRSAKIMIPGRRQCTSGWTKEYEGYLVTERHNHPAKAKFECLDQAAETVPGSYADRNGALMYIVQAQCGSLPCPRYINNREVTCVVCTK